ncbi:amidase [Arthrospiribacter ruber]|uniref:Amidase n=1 Tax=Arthrospiribacter ruber TaxID=2487934 RepID=A0A951IZB5_9BACT|nr:amidase [Arthrospiribacter ruber]MBW3468646.1 amidase [Arthrospiribacter ruber]
MRKFGWVLLLAGFCLGFLVAQSGNTFKRADVRAALRLIQVEFNRDEIDTMMDYLRGNLKGYEKMREFPLENHIDPAMAFDPFPVDYIFPTQTSVLDWKLPVQVNLPENQEDIAYLSIPELAYLIKNKKISSRQLTEIYLDRIKKYDPQLLSFITLTEELALAQADQADEDIASGKYRGILHGIPYGVKDLASVPGYPTTWGAAPYKNQVIDQKASIIQKLEDQGAILLGKLVTGSLARGDVWFGGQTKNPWDLSQGATGSSAGSGSAVSAGLAAFAIGTETLGSIISPSTRTGVTGLRPTYGTVSRHGFMVLSWSMDKVGPICRSVEDCAIVYDHIRGQDRKDRSSKPSSFEYNLHPDIQKLKIAQLKFNSSSLNPTQEAAYLKTLDEFKALNLEIQPIELPTDYPFEAFDIILRAESGAFFDALVREGGHRDLVEQDESSRANSLRQSRLIPAVEYLQANRYRRKLIDEIHALFKEYDVILSSTYGGRQMLITNLTGHPALSIPNGFDDQGRPTSITLIGNYFEEAKILHLANAYQKQFDYHKKRPSAYKESSAK